MNDTRPSKKVHVDHFEPLSLIGYIVRIESLLLALPFSLLWSLIYVSYLAAGDVIGFFVIARSAIGLFFSLTLFCCYSLVVIDYTARGFQHPPKMSGALVTENKSRFIKVAIVVSFLISLVSNLTNDEWPILFISLLALILPITLATVAIQDNLTRALNPLTWFRFGMAIRFDQHTAMYLLCFSIATGIGLALKTMDVGSWAFELIAALTLSLLALARSIGILIHANAAELGLPVLYSKEIELKQLAQSERQQEKEFSATLYRLLEADKTQQAWLEYQTYIHRQGPNSEARLWETCSQWPNPALALLAGQPYIERLYKQGQYQKAWVVLSLCFKRNENEYTLSSASTTLGITLYAQTSRERFISCELLKYFPKDFPNHPESSTALLRAVEFMVNDSNDFATSNHKGVESKTTGFIEAKKLFDQTRIQYPQVKQSERYLRLEALLKVKANTRK